MTYDEMINSIFPSETICHSDELIDKLKSRKSKSKYSSEDISAIFENDRCLFFKVEKQDKTDNTIVMVNKKTLKPKEILYTEYIIKYSSGCKLAQGEIKHSDGSKSYYGNIKDKNEVIHYGIKQTPDGKGSGRFRKNFFDKGTKSRKIVEDIEQAHATGAVLASNSVTVATTAYYIRTMAQQAILSNPIVQKALNNPYVQAFIYGGYAGALVERGLNFKSVRDIRSKRAKNRSGEPDENGFYKLKKKETLDQVIDNANPYHGNALGNRNCWSCAVAASLRENGYDTVSKPIALGVPSLTYWLALKNPKQVTKIFPSMNNFVDAASMKKRILTAYGNPKKANGVIMVNWNGGGGHAFNWTVDNGNFKFYDSQIREHDLNLVTRYFNDVNHYTPIVTYRMDNAKFDPNMLNLLVDK